MPRGPIALGTKCLREQLYQEPNALGTKYFGNQLVHGPSDSKTKWSRGPNSPGTKWVWPTTYIHTIISQNERKTSCSAFLACFFWCVQWWRWWYTRAALDFLWNPSRACAKTSKKHALTGCPAFDKFDVTYVFTNYWTVARVPASFIGLRKCTWSI